MFRRKPNAELVKLDVVIDRILREMAEVGPDAPEYPRLLKRLKKAMGIRKTQSAKNIDWNTALLVAGNLLGILVIVAYEQKHVMTSKGLGFIIKPKH